ncbi:MAG: metal-sensing transcriptional repressor [Bacteroidota bacterium]|nr:metal-sensing transcriptional repressor [Rhodothermia bacterium]MDW8285649.1 metal-sensing transcriptional repressor [Bacteroidota bacterium]
MPTANAASSAEPPAIQERAEILRRLARVEGQIRALQRMIREGADCVAIAQQMAAARQALHKAFTELLSQMLIHECVAPEGLTDEEHQNLHRFTEVLRRYL